MARTSKPNANKRLGSAGRGGPGTYAGANFQTLIGVLEMVNLLGSLAVHPWQELIVTTEPRSFGVNGQLGYDIGLPSTHRRLEVKRNPTREDVREFVRAVADDPDALRQTATFEFVHGQGSKAAGDLTEVGRSAREAVDHDHFSQLVASLSEEQRELISLLGSDAFAKARQVTVRHLTAGEARSRVEWLTDRMYGTREAEAVRDHLAVKFSAAAEDRVAIHVSELRDELASRGGDVRIGPTADISGFSVPVQDALAVLASLDAPVPAQLLALVVNAPKAELITDLGAFVSAFDIGGETAVLLATPLGGFTHAKRSHLLTTTLSRLLELAGDRTRRSLALSQVRNIARLAEELLPIDPALVARVYPIRGEAIQNDRKPSVGANHVATVPPCS